MPSESGHLQVSWGKGGGRVKAEGMQEGQGASCRKSARLMPLPRCASALGSDVTPGAILIQKDFKKSLLFYDSPGSAECFL